jgi:hypothetical protein
MLLFLSLTEESGESSSLSQSNVMDQDSQGWFFLQGDEKTSPRMCLENARGAESSSPIVTPWNQGTITGSLLSTLLSATLW